MAMVYAALLLGPPAAVAVYFLVRLSARRALSWMLMGAAGYIVIIVFAGAIGLRFTAEPANIASLALIGPAWWFCLACGCWAEDSSRRALSWLVAIPSVGLNYLLATVGLFAVVIMVGEDAAAPMQSYEIRDLACEVTLWGGMGSDEGYAIVLYRRWTAAPWIRFRLTEVRVDETASEPNLSCADLDGRFKGVVRPLYSSPSPRRPLSQAERDAGVTWRAIPGQHGIIPPVPPR